MSIVKREKEGYFLKVIRLEFNIPVKSEQEEEQLLALYCDGSLHNLIRNAIISKPSNESDIDAKFECILNLLKTSERKSTSIPVSTTPSVPPEQTLPPKRNPSKRKGLIGGKTLKRN